MGGNGGGLTAVGGFWGLEFDFDVLAFDSYGEDAATCDVEDGAAPVKSACSWTCSARVSSVPTRPCYFFFVLEFAGQLVDSRGQGTNPVVHPNHIAFFYDVMVRGASVEVIESPRAGETGEDMLDTADVSVPNTGPPLCEPIGPSLFAMLS
jgi:hypothetical protein